MPYDIEHKKEAVDSVHRELWFLSISLYEQGALPEYRLLAEVIRLYELHYRMLPIVGFQDRSVDCIDVNGEEVQARTG